MAVEHSFALLRSAHKLLVEIIQFYKQVLISLKECVHVLG